MLNIFLFVRRFSIFLLFVLLQTVSLYMLFTYNRSHRAAGLGVAGNVTSYFNNKYNKIEDFFTMQEENRRVHRMNDSLMNLLSTNFITNAPPLPKDTTEAALRYKWRSAQVLYSTANNDKNYLQINKGRRDGIANDMGVFSSNGGIVGKVINTGESFSEIMSLLNVVAKTSVQLKRTGSAGMLSWDGKTPNELTLTNIPRTDSARKGDTIITGNYSQSYPAGKMVGTVSAILKEQSSNFYILKIKPAANLSNLQQVFVVENLNYTEQTKLHQQTTEMVEKGGGDK